MFKVFNTNCPTYFRERFHRTSEIHDYNLRGSNYDLQLPLPIKTNFLKRSFSYRDAIVVNAEGPFFTISQFKEKQGLFHSFDLHSTMARSHTTQNRDFLESISFSF